jgi:hypothetical protein
MSAFVLQQPRPMGHAVARRTEPTFAPVPGKDGARALRVLHPGSAPAQLSLWLRPSGAR